MNNYKIQWLWINVFWFCIFLKQNDIDKQALKREEASTVKVQASETSYAIASQKHGAVEPSIESSSILIKYLRHTGLH